MNARDYMKLPYTRLVEKIDDESGHYFLGRILELDGCQSTGDTLEELYESLDEAMEGYIEVIKTLPQFVEWINFGIAWSRGGRNA